MNCNPAFFLFILLAVPSWTSAGAFKELGAVGKVYPIVEPDIIAELQQGAPKLDLKKMKEKRPGLKIVIVTGYKSVETATEAVRLGASGYIVKPFKSEEILATAKSVL